MNKVVTRTIHTAVTRWARRTFTTAEELLIGAVAADEDEEGRYPSTSSGQAW